MAVKNVSYQHSGKAQRSNLVKDLFISKNGAVTIWLATKTEKRFQYEECEERPNDGLHISADLKKQPSRRGQFSIIYVSKP